ERINPRPVPAPCAQHPQLVNTDSILAWIMSYRLRCAACHGLDASGYRGPDLMAVLAGGATDQRLFQTMRKGVPGTEMPSSTSPDDDLLQVIAYLRKLGSVAAPETPIGNIDSGARL